MAIGAALRLVAAIVSDPTPGDDAGRLAAACRWAERPQWLGLSGVWSPLHAYLLGGLIRLFGSPIFAARVLGFVSTTATLPFFFLAVREAWGDSRRAGLATLLLAISWVHIWMAGTAYAEGPYLCALIASVAWALGSANRQGAVRDRWALGAGLAMALAVLLRHEAKLVAVLVLAWLALYAGRRAAVRFGIPALAAMVWQLIEPSLRGASFAHDAKLVAAMKAEEVALHGTIVEALRRWILMPAGSPGVVIVALGLFGLWLGRRAWRRDLFLWLFAAQVALYFALTLYPGWQPYLRYLFLYFVFLLPAAAGGLEAASRRSRVLVPALVILAVLTQGVAWWRGRNEGRPLGWLPIYRAAPEQGVLDGWVREHGGEGRVLAMAAYPGAWDWPVSALRANRCDLLDRCEVVSYDDELKLARGERIPIAGFDRVLLDPTAAQYQALLASLPRERQFEMRAGRLEVVRLGAARRP